MAGAEEALTGALGVNMSWIFRGNTGLAPLSDNFGYIQAGFLIGLCQCDTPFGPDAGTPIFINAASSNNWNSTNDITQGPNCPLRTCFGNHTFISYSPDGNNNYIFDATLGPHLGTENLSSYLDDPVDARWFLYTYSLGSNGIYLDPLKASTGQKVPYPAQYCQAYNSNPGITGVQ
jgi:hypothetical protein